MPFRALNPLWSVMDSGCSSNFRPLACGTYLPKCTNNTQGEDVIVKPCRETCQIARRRCRTAMAGTTVKKPYRIFRCQHLPIGARRQRPGRRRQRPGRQSSGRRRQRSGRGRSRSRSRGRRRWQSRPNRRTQGQRQPSFGQGTCLRPVQETRRMPNRRRTTPTALPGSTTPPRHVQNVPYAFCTGMDQFDMCGDLNITLGSLPNYFQQHDPVSIRSEMEQYRDIFDCHPHFRFLLCGIFKPFCLSTERYTHVVPCSETCEEVKTACEPSYRTSSGGLSWPAKLQCHLFIGRPCVNPGDDTIINA